MDEFLVQMIDDDFIMVKHCPEKVVVHIRLSEEGTYWSLEEPEVKKLKNFLEAWLEERYLARYNAPEEY